MGVIAAVMQSAADPEPGVQTQALAAQRTGGGRHHYLPGWATAPPPLVKGIPAIYNHLVKGILAGYSPWVTGTMPRMPLDLVGHGRARSHWTRWVSRGDHRKRSSRTALSTIESAGGVLLILL